MTLCSIVSSHRSVAFFVPKGAIGGALDRIENLIQSAEEVAQFLAKDDDDDWNKYMDAAFARLAGYKMRDDGTVVKVAECRTLRPPIPKNERSRNSYRRRQTVTGAKYDRRS